MGMKKEKEAEGQRNKQNVYSGSRKEEEGVNITP